MLKLTPSLSYLDAPIESEKWKNLLFDKRGKSYLGGFNHSSELEAAQHHFRTRKTVMCAELTAFIGAPMTGRWELRIDDYSYAIQIPWKE